MQKRDRRSIRFNEESVNPRQSKQSYRQLLFIQIAKNFFSAHQFSKHIHDYSIKHAPTAVTHVDKSRSYFSDLELFAILVKHLHVKVFFVH